MVIIHSHLFSMIVFGRGLFILPLLKQMPNLSNKILTSNSNI